MSRSKKSVSAFHWPLRVFIQTEPEPLPPSVSLTVSIVLPPPPGVKTHRRNGVFDWSHLELSSWPFVVPWWVHTSEPSAETTPVDANIAPRTRAPDATRPKTFRLLMMIASPSALCLVVDRTYECVFGLGT